MNSAVVIIGAGPAGLTIAYVLATLGWEIVLIDEADTIGGCHRGMRVDGLFTEHGPRVYSSSYRTTAMLLNDMKISFSDIFTPARFDLVRAIRELNLPHFGLMEIAAFVGAFLNLLLDPNYGTHESMAAFMNRHGFSQSVKIFVDNFCRFSDGAGAERYTLQEFLQAANQQAFYGLYEPKLPNDVGLFPRWKEALLGTGRVQILTNYRVVQIHLQPDQKSVQKVDIVHATSKKKETIVGKTFIVAIPPRPFVALLSSSPNPVLQNAFGPLECVQEIERNTTYYNSVTLVYHWDQTWEAKNVLGFPSNEWGIVLMVLSNFMTFDNTRSRVVISAGLTKMNVPSPVTKKTADQSTLEEIISEVFRLLRTLYPNAPEYTKAVVSPRTYRDVRRDQWDDLDTSWIRSFHTNRYLPQRSATLKNFFYVNSSNGKSDFYFTSFESAVQNAIVFIHDFDPRSKSRFPLKKPVTISIVIRWILWFIVLYALLKLFIYTLKNS